MKKTKALIMAGGRGVRLAPLTDDIPKPLVPVMNVPVIAHAIDKLVAAGVSDAAVTLGYGGDDIKKYFSSYGTRGVRVLTFEEETPLGTAGGAANAKKFFDDDFIALGGDTLFDINIEAAFSFHRRAGALATVILSSSDDPCRYGTALCDKTGKVTSLSEKPEWKNVYTDKISTGIYILSPKIFDFIPEGTFCDFAKDVFPKLVGDGVYAYKTDGYFCDIGTPSAYLLANMKMSGGAPCVSPRARVSGGARVERSVILDGAFIGEGTYVCDSIVCRGAAMMKNSSAVRSFLAPNSFLEQGARAEENADIAAAVAKSAARSRAKALSARAAGEEAEMFFEERSHTAAGNVFAPHGAAKTVGELSDRGGKISGEGVVLSFDDGYAALRCVDADTLHIKAFSAEKGRAAALFYYAKRGVENLF